jgi:hypothetical protein
VAVQLHAIEFCDFVQQRRQPAPLVEQCQRLWELHLVIQFGETNHVTAATAAVTVEQAVMRIHQKAWFLIGV